MSRLVLPKKIDLNPGFYMLVLKHPRTPAYAKFLLGLAAVYFLSPIDILPDVLPEIGRLDDLFIVPGLVYLAFRLIPPDVIEECRRKTASPSAKE
ncbi:MAG TPA: DUF1232 domain-containing protein [Candidatus Eisenbacteria bacterium]|nr:DUF1232 domain-containing protein [Candidatus Eisenbacteria bacterium]